MMSLLIWCYLIKTSYTFCAGSAFCSRLAYCAVAKCFRVQFSTFSHFVCYNINATEMFIYCVQEDVHLGQKSTDYNDFWWLKFDVEEQTVG